MSIIVSVLHTKVKQFYVLFLILSRIQGGISMGHFFVVGINIDFFIFVCLIVGIKMGSEKQEV